VFVITTGIKDTFVVCLSPSPKVFYSVFCLLVYYLFLFNLNCSSPPSDMHGNLNSFTNYSITQHSARLSPLPDIISIFFILKYLFFNPMNSRNGTNHKYPPPPPTSPPPFIIYLLKLDNEKEKKKRNNSRKRMKQFAFVFYGV